MYKTAPNYHEAMEIYIHTCSLTKELICPMIKAIWCLCVHGKTAVECFYIHLLVHTCLYSHIHLIHVPTYVRSYDAISHLYCIKSNARIVHGNNYMEPKDIFKNFTLHLQ